MTKAERERIKAEIRRLAIELVCFTHPQHHRRREELAERIAELRRRLNRRVGR